MVSGHFRKKWRIETHRYSLFSKLSFRAGNAGLETPIGFSLGSRKIVVDSETRKGKKKNKEDGRNAGLAVTLCADAAEFSVARR